MLVDGRTGVNRTCEGRSPLHCACRNGQATCTQLLVDSDADINADDEGGSTPLSIACLGGFEACVQLLVDANGGADVSWLDASGMALCFSCQDGHEACVRVLVGARAD